MAEYYSNITQYKLCSRDSFTDIFKKVFVREQTIVKIAVRKKSISCSFLFKLLHYFIMRYARTTQNEIM